MFRCIIRNDEPWLEADGWSEQCNTAWLLSNASDSLRSLCLWKQSLEVELKRESWETQADWFSWASAETRTDMELDQKPTALQLLLRWSLGPLQPLNEILLPAWSEVWHVNVKSPRLQRRRPVDQKLLTVLTVLRLEDTVLCWESRPYLQPGETFWSDY